MDGLTQVLQGQCITSSKRGQRNARKKELPILAPDGTRELPTRRYQYPSAQPSLRGSEPPVSVPLSQSIQIAWPPPSGPTTLVVLCPSFFRPSTMADGTPSSSW